MSKFSGKYIHRNDIVEYGTDQFSPRARGFFEDVKGTLIDGAKPKDRAPVLSHCDLANINVMMTLIRNEKGVVVDIGEVVMIDWETMCWSPPWLEAAHLHEIWYFSHEYQSLLYNEAWRKMGKVNLGMVLLWGWALFAGYGAR